MVWATENPISQTNRRIYYDICLVGKFLFHMSKKLFEVDMVDTIVDKFESVNFSLHFSIIQCPYNDLVERKRGDSVFIVLCF